MEQKTDLTSVWLKDLALDHETVHWKATDLVLPMAHLMVQKTVPLLDCMLVPKMEQK